MKRLVMVSLLLALALPFSNIIQGAQQSAGLPKEAAALAGLRWRSIGPANMGGRVTDIVGITGDPSTFYVAGANGGIHKTTNGGTTFRAIFENQAVYSIGAIAIAPSDTNVIWVGTGEGDPRNSASFGNGVYRSTDAGETWKYLGLPDSERIKRIRIHPTDPDTAWVAALGHAWGANEERGVFKTTDGGKTWKKVLYIDQDTGCSDLDIDSQNPRILYAGMYTFRRKAWHFTSGGGATALYQSKDGGETWTKLTNGLPRTPMDRIGIAVARSNPNIVYMITETKSEGNLFRSDDRGATWRSVYDNPNINFRPFYYSDIRVDPNDPERLYSLSGSLSMSGDGGRTFNNLAQNVHGDHQSLWIDPANSNRILSGSDGGFQISNDKGRTFEIFKNLVLSQFYHITYDMRRPFYYVYGGLQDNGNWVGPSATNFREGIRTDDWATVSGGDGFFAVPELDEPNIIYSDSQGGTISVIDTNTGWSRNINPYPKEVGSTGGQISDYKYRFNWNPPIVRSPHDPKTIYFGGNVLFKTANRGQSWEVLSGDLTTNDKSKQQSSGGQVVTDNTAAEFHCTILTIAESPVQKGVIWVGTDDGNIQITKDHGKTWTNVVANIKGLPANSYVPMIDASPHDAGTAFVAVDRHRDDDFSPHAFKTTDYGQTWSAIQGNLPAKAYVHVVREDPKVKNLLYAGTELGVFASWDGGASWVSIRNNLPPVAVNDLAIHPRENDLIIGTHGRGAWILDNLTPLQNLAQAQQVEAMLFDIRPAMRMQTWSKDSNLGSKIFTGQNLPPGAMIDYYLKQETREPITITITDKSGKVIRAIRQLPNQGNKAGINRVMWDLRYDGARQAPGAQAGGRGFGGGGQGAGGRGGAGGGQGLGQGAGARATAAPAEVAEIAARFGFGGGPAVLPGEYNVTLKVGNKPPMTKSVKVELDPRLKVSEAELTAQLNAALAMRELVSRLNQVIAKVDDLTQQLTTLQTTLRRDVSVAMSEENAPNGAANVQADINAALDELRKLRARLVRECNFGYRCPGKLREDANSLMNGISSPIAEPTEGQKLRMREITDEVGKVIADLNALIAGSVKRVNDKLSSSPHIVTGAAVK
ncbi:MAG: hypothetical protein AB1757_13965 [Acidobacteriota bacterium]